MHGVHRQANAVQGNGSFLCDKGRQRSGQAGHKVHTLIDRIHGQNLAGAIDMARNHMAPEPVASLVQEAWTIGRKGKIDPTLILAIVAIESSFNPFAQSPVGAQGLMQVMTRVHDEKYSAFGGKLAAFDPLANLRVGAQILSEYLARADGNVELALKYYVGAANLPDDGGYAERVLAERGFLRAVADGQAVAWNVPNTRSNPQAQAPGQGSASASADSTPASAGSASASAGSTPASAGCTSASAGCTSASAGDRAATRVSSATAKPSGPASDSVAAKVASVSATASRFIRARVSTLRFTASTSVATFASSPRPAKFSLSAGVVARTRTASRPPFTSGSHPPEEMWSFAAVVSALVSMPLPTPSSCSFQSSAKAALKSGKGFVGSSLSA